MPSVSSSAIAAVEHDPVSLTLRVTFRGSGTYTYEGVPRSLYEAFLRAPSKGTFFNEHIRDRFSSAR